MSSINNWVSNEKFESRNQAMKVLNDVKAKRAKKKYELIRIDGKTLIEKEIK